ncbi:hypothetical protein Tco_0021019, partial [Tanacetum coccineum]
ASSGYLFVSAVLVYLLYGSAGGHVITTSGGRSYKENSSSWFLVMVPAGSSWFLLVVPAGRLCGSCWYPPPRSLFPDDNESRSHSRSTSLTIYVISCLTLSDLEYVANSYDQ